MRISLVTPAPEGSRSGNRTTALRWARLFEALGHTVEVAVRDDRDDADLMVALHAWRSADSIARFRERHPARPLIVALAGTDVYRDLSEHRATVEHSLDCADALVGLHDLVADELPARFRAKVTVIYQSTEPTADVRSADANRFEVVVVGNLRDEKDPLRAAFAARLLPPVSRIAVVHLGGAFTPEWAARAGTEMAENPRYAWRGEMPGAEVRAAISRARLMVLSSIMEGGANVISEALVAGTPVLASRIDGTVGLLGRDYPGYFPIGDTPALTDLLVRAETEPAFLSRLRDHCAMRAPLFTTANEREAWRGLFERVGRLRDGGRPAPPPRPEGARQM